MTFSKHPFLFYHLIGALLLVTFFLPGLSTLWGLIDSKTFHLLNHSFLDRPNWQLFWAFANHRLADWLEDLCILGFFLAAIAKAPKSLKKRRSAEMIFIILLIAVTILLFNRLICRDLLRLRRLSPTAIFEQPFLLSETLPWMTIKDISSKSFPGDHATTALIFGLSYFRFVKGRLGLAALIYALFLCLPRLMAGAHWLSDLIVGTGLLISFVWGLSFGTPLAEKCITRLEKILPSK
jgi:membrane-associated phospholipid phosphatase